MKNIVLDRTFPQYVIRVQSVTVVSKVIKQQ